MERTLKENLLLGGIVLFLGVANFSPDLQRYIRARNFFNDNNIDIERKNEYANRIMEEHKADITKYPYNQNLFKRRGFKGEYFATKIYLKNK